MKKLFVTLMIFALIFVAGCKTEDDGKHKALDKGDLSGIDVRKEMRQLVIEISGAAKAQKSGFAIIPQNGQEVAWDDYDAVEKKAPYADYIAAIDGIGREDMFFGYDDDNKATKTSDSEYLAGLCSVYKNAGKTVLATDYCWGDNEAVSYEKNFSRGFTGYAAPDRELNKIPAVSENAPYLANSADVKKLSDAKNFLYLINPDSFGSAEKFVEALSQTDFDLLLIDLFFDGEPLTSAQVEALKTKANGGKRLVVCYMSIGEAEDYRWYWNPSWKKNGPEWVMGENPAWKGNFKVKYWNEEWKKIIYSGTGSYLSKILDAGFDGVYLDIIDAYEYFE